MELKSPYGWLTFIFCQKYFLWKYGLEAFLFSLGNIFLTGMWLHFYQVLPLQTSDLLPHDIYARSKKNCSVLNDFQTIC